MPPTVFMVLKHCSVVYPWVPPPPPHSSLCNATNCSITHNTSFLSKKTQFANFREKGSNCIWVSGVWRHKLETSRTRTLNCDQLHANFCFLLDAKVSCFKTSCSLIVLLTLISSWNIFLLSTLLPLRHLNLPCDRWFYGLILRRSYAVSKMTLKWGFGFCLQDLLKQQPRQRKLIQRISV